MPLSPLAVVPREEVDCTPFGAGTGATENRFLTDHRSRDIVAAEVFLVVRGQYCGRTPVAVSLEHVGPVAFGEDDCGVRRQRNGPAEFVDGPIRSGGEYRGSCLLRNLW